MLASNVLRTACITAVLGPLASACAVPEPQNPAAALLQEADQLRTQGDPEGAIPVYEEAIGLDPELAGAYLGLAISHSTLGNTAEAEKSYLLADAKDPEDVQIKLNLAGFYYRNRNYDRSLWALQRALDIAPEGEEARLISALWARVETAKVRAQMRGGLLESLAENPNDEATISALAGSYAKEALELVQAGNGRESLAVAREAMERVPEPAQAELYFVGAQAHGALGDETAAFEWVEKAIELDDGVARYHLSHAGFLSDRKEYEGALDALDMVIELAPVSEEAAFARIRSEEVALMQQVPEERVEEYLRERAEAAKARKKAAGSG